MKLTHLQCLTLDAALRKLDACKFPKSANGHVRYNIAKNLRLLKPALEIFEDARVSLVNDLSNGKGTIEPNTPESIEFSVEIRALQKKEAGEFALLKMKCDDLDMETNAIAPSVLADLEHVLDGEPS